MKEAMGGTWLTGLVIVFIFLFAGFLAYSILYINGHYKLY